MPHESDLPPEKHAQRPDHQPWPHSTGPKTEEGKAISSQNARTHGCTSTHCCCPTKTPPNGKHCKPLGSATTRPIGTPFVNSFSLPPPPNGFCAATTNA